MLEEQTPTQTYPPELKRIKTFQSDVEELIQKQQISKAAIALAESERRVKKEEVSAQPSAPAPAHSAKILTLSGGLPPAAPKWNTSTLLAVVVLVLAVLGMGTGVYFFLKQNAPLQISPPSVNVKSGTAITLNTKESREKIVEKIRSHVQALSVPQNEVRVIPIVLDGKTITTTELLEEIEASVPAALLRALGTEPVLGVHGFRGGQPFLLFSVHSYDHAFDGILSWEPNLLREVGPLFGISVRNILGRVASTTSDILENTLTIKDVIIRNKDARVVLGPGEEKIFLYSFLDKETLVLTTNTDTLQFLIGKAWGGRLR